MVDEMRMVLCMALAVSALGTGVFPAPAEACDNCDRDGSRHYLLKGEFVRYHRVRFQLSVRVRDSEREWVDTVEVVPMAERLVTRNLVHLGGQVDVRADLTTENGPYVG